MVLLTPLPQETAGEFITQFTFVLHYILFLLVLVVHWRLKKAKREGEKRKNQSKHRSLSSIS
jgi:preprotein translocase subunit SecG